MLCKISTDYGSEKKAMATVALGRSHSYCKISFPAKHLACDTRGILVLRSHGISPKPRIP